MLGFFVTLPTPTLRADVFTNFIFQNYFIMNDAPFRYLAAEDDDSGTFPVPSANPSMTWNPASLIYYPDRFVGLSFKNQTFHLSDSVNNDSFSTPLSFLSSAFYIEPPNSLVPGVVAIGWDAKNNNLDFNQPAFAIQNYYDRQLWSGGAVWAFPLNLVGIQSGSGGLMVGYRRFLDHKRNEIALFPIEDYSQDVQGFYGKVGFVYPILPSFIEIEGTYHYGGNLNGAVAKNSLIFFTGHPTDDYGFDFAGISLPYPDPDDDGSENSVFIRYPDDFGGMLRVRPAEFLTVTLGASKILWSQYNVHMGGIDLSFGGQSLEEDQIYRVHTGDFMDITQVNVGLELNLLNAALLKIGYITDPDPDPDPLLQTNRNFTLATLLLNLKPLTLNASYLSGTGNSADATVSQSFQAIKGGVTYFFGTGSSQEKEWQ